MHCFHCILCWQRRRTVATLTVRNVDDSVKTQARLAAARNGRSMEAEIRALLEATYRPADDRAARIKAMSGTALVDHLVAVAGGVELVLPSDATDSDRDIFGAD
ncbi:MAG: plasmid stabilization protein [Alphaproteobacteria bacterium]|nr:plasmid stabilization protein [Alphaproteobacteria bacterium]